MVKHIYTTPITSSFASQLAGVLHLDATRTNFSSSSQTAIYTLVLHTGTQDDDMPSQDGDLSPSEMW